MEHLLTLQYYFNPHPDFNFRYTKAVLAIIALFLGGSLVLSYYRRKKVKDVVIKKILKTYPSRLWWFGIALLFLLLFRETGLPYLSMRVLWAIWLVIFIYWAVRKVTGFRNEYTNRRESRMKSSEGNKYLPKRRKR